MALNIADQAKRDQTRAEVTDNHVELTVFDSTPVIVPYRGNMPPRTYKELIDAVIEIMVDEDHPMNSDEKTRMLGRVAYIGLSFKRDEIVARTTFVPEYPGGIIELPTFRPLEMNEDLTQYVSASF